MSIILEAMERAVGAIKAIKNLLDQDPSLAYTFVRQEPGHLVVKGQHAVWDAGKNGGFSTIVSAPVVNALIEYGILVKKTGKDKDFRYYAWAPVADYISAIPELRKLLQSEPREEEPEAPAKKTSSTAVLPDSGIKFELRDGTKINLYDLFDKSQSERVLRELKERFKNSNELSDAEKIYRKLSLMRLENHLKKDPVELRNAYPFKFNDAQMLHQVEDGLRKLRSVRTEDFVEFGPDGFLMIPYDIVDQITDFMKK